jgi:hypothetical protein
VAEQEGQRVVQPAHGGAGQMPEPFAGQPVRRTLTAE